MHRSLVIACVACFSAGCAAPSIPRDREAAFSFAVARQNTGDHLAAAAGAWRYFQGGSPDDPRYDRTQRLLARAAEGLGLTYAASLWYLDIAQARRDPELLPSAVAGLQRIIEQGAYDEATLVDGFLASAEVSGLPDALQAFVDYQQGLQNARLRLDGWADARFAAIVRTSPFKVKAEYVQAVRQIAGRQLDAATVALEGLLEREHLPAAFATEIRRSLARLALEQRDYPGAIKQYEALRALAPNDPDLLLEMAWAHYYKGDARRALGLLLALDAPAYHDLIAPERFLLEALCLRRLCQFGPARQAAVRLRRRHGDALSELYRGATLLDSPALRAAARRREAVRALSRFVDRVEAERAVVAELGDDLTAPLHRYLKQLYDRGVREAHRRLDARLSKEVDNLADELLFAEEGVRLILHELGVALLRGRRPPEGPPEAPPIEIPVGGDRVFLRFEGEFWTDELDDLIVVAEDRCID